MSFRYFVVGLAMNINIMKEYLPAMLENLIRNNIYVNHGYSIIPFWKRLLTGTYATPAAGGIIHSLNVF